MFYDEEELLEAVDILVEDYGFDEDYAIDLVMESYEEDLDELSEAVDILVEEYGFDEDYAIELVSESYEDLLLEDESENFIDSLSPEERAFGKNLVNGARTGALVVGTGVAAKAIYDHSKRRKEKKALKNRHKRQMEYISLTGKRLHEGTEARQVLKDAYGVHDNEHITRGQARASYALGALGGAAVVAGSGAVRGVLAKRRHKKKMNKLSKKYYDIENTAIEERKLRKARKERKRQ